MEQLLVMNPVLTEENPEIWVFTELFVSISTFPKEVITVVQQSNGCGETKPRNTGSC